MATEDTVGLPDDVPASTNNLRAIKDGTDMPTGVLAEVLALQGVEGLIAEVNTRTDGTKSLEVSTADSAEREYTHVVATVTASGDTTVHTPAAGNAIRLRWIYVMTDPTSLTVPMVKVSLGAAEKYRIYGGLQKRQVTTGAADALLIVNLSAAGNVVVTALLEEITP